MANRDLVALLKSNSISIQEAINSFPGSAFDLQDAELSGFNFHRASLHKAVFTGAKLVNCNLDGVRLDEAHFSRVVVDGGQALGASFASASLEGTKFVSVNASECNFTDANLSNADFTGSILTGSQFKQAMLNNTNFRNANLVNSKELTGPELRKCVLAGSRLNQMELSECDFSKMDLRGTCFSGAKLINTNLSSGNLTEADLSGADLSGANLNDSDLSRANLNHAKLWGASLVGTTFRGARFENTDLSDSDVERADFAEALIDRPVFNHVKNIDKSKRLDLTNVISEILYGDTLKFSKTNTYLSWERLRSVGKLPLFGASYVAMIAIPIFFYGLDFYNQKIALVRNWAEMQIAVNNSDLVASLVLEKLHSQPIPPRSLAIWIAAVLLGIASTLYSLICPPRIREFSREQWRDQLGKPAFHYISHSWRHPWSRIVTAVLYAIGGLLALLLIGEKMFDVLMFILRNQTNI